MSNENITKEHKRETIYNVKDYGAIPDSENDTVMVLKSIINEILIKQEENSFKRDQILKIIFPRGIYHFYTENSSKKDYYMSNTTDINPKSIGIHIENINNLIIDGNNSTFLYHDSISPFIIDSSKNIRLHNFSIDWVRPLGSESKILDVKKTYIDLELDSKKYPYEINKGKLYFKTKYSSRKWSGVMEFEPKNRTIPINTGDNTLGINWKSYKAEKLSDTEVRLHNLFMNKPKIGDYLIHRHHERIHTGIFIIDSENIEIENINIHSTAGLGILCQYSINISFNHVKLVPNREKRQFLSGHDDGFHITNCKGEISINNCEFEGLMDDPINIHGVAVRIDKKLAHDKLIIKFMHHQSKNLKFGEKGDLVSLINAKTMESVETAHIKSIKIIDYEKLMIEFNEEIPNSIKKGDALENLTWTPNVIIENSKLLMCRARGLLLSTPRDVIIRNNYFHSSGSAILIAGDVNMWYESGAVKNVTITNNIFSEFCLSNIYQFCNAIISIYPEIPKPSHKRPFHRNIIIKNNIFNPFDYPVLYAVSTEKLTFINNIINRSHVYEPFHPHKYTFFFKCCSQIKIKDNKIEDDVLGKNIKIVKMPISEIESDENLKISQ